MDLILLRHGETIHNTQRRYCSDDNPLSEEGIIQMEKAADRIHNLIIDRVMVSPLLRARQSFEIINKYHQFPYEIVNDIREIDPGKLQGLTFNEGLNLYPKEVEDYLFDYIDTPLPGGESVREAYERVGKVITRIRNYSGNILMVTHGGVISLVLSYVLGDVKNYHRFNVDNGSFTLIQMDNFPRIRYINRLK